MGGNPLTTTDKQVHRCRWDSREARQGLYWGICHRHTQPWLRGAWPGTSQGQVGPLGVDHVIAYPGWAASGPLGEEPALGGFQGPRVGGRGRLPRTTRVVPLPHPHLFFLLAELCTPGHRDRCRDPRPGLGGATLWVLVSSHLSASSSRGS